MTDARKEQDTRPSSSPSNTNDGGNSPMRGQEDQKPQDGDQANTGSHRRPSDDEDEGHS